MNGIINQSKASEDFLNYYGKEFLDLLDLNVGTNKKNWLKKLLSYTEHNNSTVKHLLVIDFLGIDLNELFNQIYLYEPFGEGPWPCLNKNEKHYEQNIVNDLKLEYDYKTKCIVGIFTCSCGYKYRLRYKKTLISDRELLKKLNDLIREKDFQTIIKRLNQGLSIYDKDLDKIELVLGRKKISRNYREKMNGLKEETRKRHHEIWLNLRKQYPQKSKNELVELSISTASWLYKFDKEWFEENSPEKKQSTNYKKTRIDWNKKDKELYYTAKKVIEELYKEDKNLNRVTKSRVLKMCGVKYYSSEMLKKLPKTKKFIDDNIEEVQEFRIRKIKWKIADLFKKEEEITLTKLLSGMTANKSEKEELKLIIENELKKYRI